MTSYPFFRALDTPVSALDNRFRSRYYHRK